MTDDYINKIMRIPVVRNALSKSALASIRGGVIADNYASNTPLSLRAKHDRYRLRQDYVWARALRDWSKLASAFVAGASDEDRSRAFDGMLNATLAVCMDSTNDPLLRRRIAGEVRTLYDTMRPLRSSGCNLRVCSYDPEDVEKGRILVVALIETHLIRSLREGPLDFLEESLPRVRQSYALGAANRVGRVDVAKEVLSKMMEGAGEDEQTGEMVYNAMLRTGDSIWRGSVILQMHRVITKLDRTAALAWVWGGFRLASPPDVLSPIALAAVNAMAYAAVETTIINSTNRAHFSDISYLMYTISRCAYANACNNRLLRRVGGG
jgi:hypothetical protein